VGLGYLSAWQSMYAMRAEQEERLNEVSPELIARKGRTKQIVREIRNFCRKRPDDWFHIVVIDAYVSVVKQMQEVQK
jgi:hypothetical protein